MNEVIKPHKPAFINAFGNYEVELDDVQIIGIRTDPIDYGLELWEDGQVDEIAVLFLKETAKLFKDEKGLLKAIAVILMWIDNYPHKRDEALERLQNEIKCSHEKTPA